MKYSLFFLVFSFFSGWFPQSSHKVETIYPIEKENLKISEPSDLAVSPDGKSLYIVGDDGHLYQTNINGEIIKRADYEGIDCEGVYTDENYVYVVEEATRIIKKFDINTLTLLKNITIPYQGARNKGYEALTFNMKKNLFITVTEKSPIWIFELNDQFQVVNKVNISSLAHDISSATYYNNFVWLLSDEDQMVLKVKPDTYELIQKWKIPVLNPEGIAFNDSGQLLILSDAMQKLFCFNPIENF